MATKKSKSKTGSRKKASKKIIKKPKNRTPPGTPPDTILKRYPGEPDTPNVNPYTGENVLISYKSELPITVPVLMPPPPVYPDFVPDSFNTNINRSNNATVTNVPTYEEWISTVAIKSEPKEDPIEEYLKLLRKGGKKRRKTRKRRGGKRRNTKKHSNPASIPE